MRIISGTHKGRRLVAPKKLPVRPTTDRSKEGLFNILQHKYDLKNTSVLDLFSGTGSFGLECISRGSSKVYFIEQYKPSIKILIKNIKKLNCEKKIKLLCENVFDLKKIKKINKNKFNIIFLDPPYKEKNTILLLNDINEMNIDESLSCVLIKNFSNKIVSKLSFEDKISYIVNVIRKRVHESIPIFILTGSNALKTEDFSAVLKKSLRSDFIVTKIHDL